MSMVDSHHLAVAPQSSAKDQSYSTVYYITLNPLDEAQRVSTNLPKMWKIGLEVKTNKWVI
jgi:hypothetical protein